MRTFNHIKLEKPLPASIEPATLLGRLLSWVTVDKLEGQLNPSPDRVTILANITRDSRPDSSGSWTTTHSFAPGPARVWNAMLANERSSSAIRGVVGEAGHGWLIIAVYTVDGSIVSLDLVRVNFRDEKFTVTMEDPAGIKFNEQPPFFTRTVAATRAATTKWLERNPQVTKVLDAPQALISTVVQQNPNAARAVSSTYDSASTWIDENPRTSKTLKIVGIGVGTAVAAPLVVGGILGAIGFGTGGVAAGSIAAGWQSTIGNVAARSLFAGLQSLGAVGLNAGAAAAVGGTAAAGAAVSEVVGGDETRLDDKEVRIINLD